MNTDARPLALLFKTSILFTLANLLYALFQPAVARISAYSILYPGRERLPFGEMHNSFVVSVDDVDAMFASHAIAREKRPDEIRVAVIGDSSVWGENMHLHETLTGQWNQLDVKCGSKTMQVYNLGYPHPSAVKDLIFLKKLSDYDPDLIVWMITLNTLSSMRINPVLNENREEALNLLDEYQLAFSEFDALEQSEKSFYEKTIIGQRSFLARLIKLQMLGWLWAATGRDLQHITSPVIISDDVSDVLEYRRLPPGSDLRSIMLVDALAAGHDIAEGIPILVVNEPIFAATGLNSDVRYNNFYPRWAYDQYLEVISAEAQKHAWNYLDAWNIIPNQYFTDTALHLNMDGERMLAARLNEEVRSLICN